MPFTDPTLIAAIDAACSSANPFERAAGHNFRWDERLGPERVRAFEQSGYLPRSSTFKDLKERYQSYLKEHLRWDGSSLPVADTFLPLNDGAALDPLPDDRRSLVRLVDIGQALADADLKFDEFRRAVDLVKANGRSGAAARPVAEARKTVNKFVVYWNAFDRRLPAFAGFARDVGPDLTEADWPDRLRRRFGIGHLDVPAGADPIPVMLLRYGVEDILRAAVRFCPAADTIRIPTVLESNFYMYFFPSPTPLPYGRTVDLGGGQDPDRLTCEVVHLPVDLEIDHIDRVAQLDRPIPGLTLAQVRNDHLEILRYDSEREDFGEMM